MTTLPRARRTVTRSDFRKGFLQTTAPEAFNPSLRCRGEMVQGVEVISPPRTISKPSGEQRLMREEAGMSPRLTGVASFTKLPGRPAGWGKVEKCDVKGKR